MVFFNIIFLILSFLSRFLTYCIIITVIVWFMYLALVDNKVTEICFYDFYKMSSFASSITKLFIDFELLMFFVYDVFIQVLSYDIVIALLY